MLEYVRLRLGSGSWINISFSSILVVDVMPLAFHHDLHRCRRHNACTTGCLFICLPIEFQSDLFTLHLSHQCRIL